MSSTRLQHEPFRPSAALATLHNADTLRGVRATWAVILGFASGMLMLAFFADSPISQSASHLVGNKLVRFARLLFPFSLLTLCSFKLNARLFRTPLGGLFILTYFGIPTISAILSQSQAYIIYGSGPFLLSGALMMVFLSCEEGIFRQFLVGVGLAAAAMIIKGIIITGLEPSTYYFRSRFHFGFSHPVATSSAIIAAAVCALTILLGQPKYKLSPGLRSWAATGTGLILLSFTALAYSRTTIMAVCGFIATYLIHNYRPIPTKALKGMVIFFISIPLGLLALSAARGQHWVPWPLNGYGRMFQFYQTLKASLQHLLDAGGIGPSPTVLDYFYAGRLSSSLVDSVFLSYSLLFGIVGLIVLLMFTFAIGWHLATYRKVVPLAMWASLITLYTTDAQGFTQSNLIIFMLLAYVMRACFPLTAALTTEATLGKTLADKGLPTSGHQPASLTKNT